MFKNAFFLISVLIAFFLYSCGDSRLADDKPDPIAPIEHMKAPPAQYQLADPSCINGDQTNALSATTIWGWQQYSVNEIKVNLSGIRSEGSLKTNLVTETTYGDRYLRTCDWSKPDNHMCDDDSGAEKGWKFSGEPNRLKVCKDNHQYPRDSYEAVGLASIHYINKAFKKYNKLSSSNKPLKELKLSILPEFVDVYENYIENGEDGRLLAWITHNSAYFPSVPMIAVFPEKASWVNSLEGFLWESSFVLAHEFGHHIDHSRNAEFLERMALKWNPILGQYIDVGANLSYANGQSSRSKMWGAVSEAFADLMAYYANDGSSKSLVGIKCFGENRDVAKSYFGEGTQKILTDEVADILFGKSSQTEITHCSDPRFSDIHTVGAILAHALDKSFSRLIRQNSNLVPESTEDFEQRYKMTLSWLDATKEAIDQQPLNLADSSLFQPINKALEKVASDFLSSFSLNPQAGVTTAEIKKDLCKYISQTLPHIDGAPFSASENSCN